MGTAQRILIVEDDEDLRAAFRIALVIAGYEVLEAGDGLDALRIVDHSPPDLIVLDFMLPNVGGDVVWQELATHVFTRSIPIVMVTGSARDLSSFDVACVLRKPVTPDALVNTVRNCLANPVRGTMA